jgi:hypothetical protein
MFGLSTGLGGTGRPAFFAKKVSSTGWTPSAAVAPCAAWWSQATPAICGLSRGAKNTNQP